MLAKELRQKKLLSQEQLAENYGLNLGTIQRGESGKRVGFASMRTQAKAFDYRADRLEYELYAMDKRVGSYKDLPLIVRLTLGQRWCYTARTELVKIEMLFNFICLVLFIVWACSFIWTFPLQAPPLTNEACW